MGRKQEVESAEISKEDQGYLTHPLDVIEMDGEKIDLNYYFTNDYSDIQQASMELPNLIEWVNWKLQLQYEDKLNFEQELKKAEADAYFDLKGGVFQDLYGCKPTDKSIQLALNRDEKVIDIWKKLNRASAWVKRLTYLQQSLTTKLDLIRSTEATRRRLIEPAELELDRKRGREDRDGD